MFTAAIRNPFKLPIAVLRIRICSDPYLPYQGPKFSCRNGFGSDLFRGKFGGTPEVQVQLQGTATPQRHIYIYAGTVTPTTDSYTYAAQPHLRGRATLHLRQTSTLRGTAKPTTRHS